MNVKSGDKIKAMGMIITIDKIYYQSFDRDSGWDIEFVDTNGVHRSYKQEFDGGEVLHENN